MTRSNSLARRGSGWNALLRPATALLLAALVPALAHIPATRAEQQQAPVRLRFYPNRGGDFRLTDHNGRPWDLQSARGRVVLLTFGYSFCPDICPVTLVNLAAAMRGLGAEEDSARAVFITLDPARDTPARLAAYMANFGVKMTGLTGTEDEVRAVARQYHVKFSIRQAHPSAGSFIDHSAFIYLLDTQGRLRYLFPHTAPPDQIAQAVRALLHGAP
jgi:protein SCO1/2